MKETEKAILDMKNKSELMLDLAYSSLLYQNKEIAKEVVELEDKINELYDTILQNVLDRKIEADTNKKLIMMKMADAIERIADAALDIADVVLRDIEPHPVIKKSLEASDVVMVRKQINEGSLLDNKKLGEVKLASETGIWVIAVKRGNYWKYGPDERTELKARDIIFARGPEDSLEILNEWTK